MHKSEQREGKLTQIQLASSTIHIKLLWHAKHAVRIVTDVCACIKCLGRDKHAIVNGLARAGKCVCMGMMYMPSNREVSGVW